MEKKNSDLVMYIVIFVILGLVIVIGIYAKNNNETQIKTNKNNIENKVNDKSKKKNENKKAKSNNNINDNNVIDNKVNEKISEQEIRRNIELILNNKSSEMEKTIVKNTDFNSKKLMDVDKLIEVFNEPNMNQIYYDFDKITAVNLPNEYIYDIIFGNSNVKQIGYYEYEYDLLELSNTATKLFGNDFSKKIINDLPSTMHVNAETVYFDKESKKYYSSVGHAYSGGKSAGYIYKIIDKKVLDDKIEVTLKYLNISNYNYKTKTSDYPKYYIYSEMNSNNITLLGTLDCTNEGIYDVCKSGPTSRMSRISNFDVDKLVSKYYDQLNTYKWTFKYDNEHDNYYFYSLEKVK